MSTPLLALSAFALLLLPWALRPLEGRTRIEIQGLRLILWWLNRFYTSTWHRLELSETDALPESGAALLVSNHTCGIDHMLLQSQTRRALGFMIAQEFYDWPLIQPFYRLVGCIPVRRDGRDLAATRGALRALDQGLVVPIFPEGRIVPTSGRVIEDGKPGAAYIALRAGVPVIPAYICGTPESNDIPTSLRTPSEARVRFGPPIPLDDLRIEGQADRSALQEATRRIMAAIRALRDGEPANVPSAAVGTPAAVG